MLLRYLKKIFYNSVAELRLKKLPEVTFTQKVESNQLFLTMPRPIIDRMLESYFFYFWNEDKDEIRLVTSFDTTEEDVDEFIRLLKR